MKMSRLSQNLSGTVRIAKPAPSSFQKACNQAFPKGDPQRGALCGSHVAHQSASSGDPAVTTPPA